MLLSMTDAPARPHPVRRLSDKIDAMIASIPDTERSSITLKVDGEVGEDVRTGIISLYSSLGWSVVWTHAIGLLQEPSWYLRLCEPVADL